MYLIVVDEIESLHHPGLIENAIITYPSRSWTGHSNSSSLSFFLSTVCKYHFSSFHEGYSSSNLDLLHYVVHYGMNDTKIKIK